MTTRDVELAPGLPTPFVPGDGRLAGRDPLSRAAGGQGTVAPLEC